MSAANKRNDGAGLLVVAELYCVVIQFFIAAELLPIVSVVPTITSKPLWRFYLIKSSKASTKAVSVIIRYLTGYFVRSVNVFLFAFPCVAALVFV